MKAFNGQLEQFLTVQDVADMLCISKSSVYRMIEKRVINFYKIRSGLRFKMEDVEQYMESCLVEAMNENEYEHSKDKKQMVRGLQVQQESLPQEES